MENSLKNIDESKLSSDPNVIDALTKFTVLQGDIASKTWKDLFFKLIVSYRDGFVITGLDEPAVTHTNSKLFNLIVLFFFLILLSLLNLYQYLFSVLSSMVA